MALSYAGNNITVQSGALCVQGRFIEEDTSSTIPVGTDAAFCKLVIEIDLDKQNTESELNQVEYKIIKGASAYPALTQTNIVKNNAGIYQYELARFKTTGNGITDFQDMRTFLDFTSIFTQIRNELNSMLSDLNTQFQTLFSSSESNLHNLIKQIQDELNQVEDESIYMLKNDIVILRGILSIPANDFNIRLIEYPSGFNKQNAIVIATGLVINGDTNERGYNFVGTYTGSSSDLLNNAYERQVNLKNNGVYLKVFNPNSDTITLEYKIALMKLNPDVSNYELGDMNMDGKINNDDLNIMQSYIRGDTALTDKQFKLGDIAQDQGSKDKIDTLDMYDLIAKINEQNEQNGQS